MMSFKHVKCSTKTFFKKDLVPVVSLVFLKVNFYTHLKISFIFVHCGFAYHLLFSNIQVGQLSSNKSKKNEPFSGPLDVELQGNTH